MMQQQPAALVVCEHPLASPRVTALAVYGTPLRDLMPDTPSPLMLRVNGAWLLRAQWCRPVLPGDVIEWHAIPMGGGQGGSRMVLTLVAMAAIAYFTMGLGAPALAGALGLDVGGFGMAALGVAANLAASALINALVPIQQPQAGAGPASPGSVYNVALAGNQARLYQPIPVIYGRMMTFPDFAAQPYTEIDAAGNQYFCAVYAVGQGSYVVERLQIDDTPIGHFQDVRYEVLAPGAAPTLALANVVTAPEVSGQDMPTGQYIGGFAACGPKSAAASIGIDIVFPRGLGLANSGTGAIGNLAATFRTEARPVDDFGTPTGAWYALATETVTRATSTPQRMSFKYKLASAARVEIRVVRTDLRSDNTLALHDMAWAGLRAYLSAAAPLCPTATHLALRVRASEQLSGMSQRRVSGIWRRKLRTWSSGGGWSALVETRNPMWARLDKLTSTVYGDGLADARIDLQTHADLAAIYDARQDRLDIVFDSKVTSLEADRTICMAGRAVPFQRAGVMTLARDQLQTLPVTAYTSRDMLPGSLSIGYALANEVTADAVIVEYFDNRAWDWREIICKAPGVTTPANAVRQRIMGVTGAKHAEREGLYLAAQNVYRRKFPKFATEMQGLLPAYGSAVILSPALPGWGQAGDVTAWDAVTMTMGLSEPPAWTSGATHYVSLLRDDGSVTGAIAATRGPTEYDVVLASAPDFTLYVDSATRERPKYIFGASGEHRIIARVLGISKRGRSDSGALTIEIDTVAEDVRVHAVDNALLPAPGEVQDPVDSSGDVGGGSGGGTATLIDLESLWIEDGNFLSGGGTGPLTYTLHDDGRASYYTPGAGEQFLANQWSLTGVLDPLEVAKYEVRASGIYATDFSGAALDTWLPLSTTRAWTFSGLDYHGLLSVQIRKAATDTVVASTDVHLFIYYTNQAP